MTDKEPTCKDHPDAPHGFDRNGSHNANRYVCTCESWTPPEFVGERMTFDCSEPSMKSIFCVVLDDKIVKTYKTYYRAYEYTLKYGGKIEELNYE